MSSLKALHKKAKTGKAPKSKQTENKSSTFSALSTEYVRESDDDDSDKQSESEDESLPENPADSSHKTNGKSPASDGSESSSEEDSGSEDGDEESSGEDEDDEEDSNKSIAQPEEITRKTTEKSLPKPAAGAPFKPPVGFEYSSITGTPQSATTFEKSNLEGKQVWYFTAPASVPISALKQTSMAAVKNGEKVLSHKDSNYGFIQDTAEDKTYTKIMFPNGADDGYKFASRPVDQILHLQKLVDLPGTRSSTVSSSRATVPAKKSVRPQPPNLKMRFLPIGFGNGDPGKIGSDSNSQDESAESESDEDMDEVSKTFKAPAPLDDTSESHSDSDEEMGEAPPLPDPALEKALKKKTEAPDSPHTSLKRKHEGGKETKKSKQSSSQQPDTIDNDRQLKCQKTKQIISRKNSTDPQLASTKMSTSVIPPLPQRSYLKDAQRDAETSCPPAQRNAASSPSKTSQPIEALPTPSISALIEKTQSKKKHSVASYPAASVPYGEERDKKKKHRKHDKSKISDAFSLQPLSTSSPTKPSDKPEIIRPPSSLAPLLGESEIKKKRNYDKKLGLHKSTKGTDVSLTEGERRRKIEKKLEKRAKSQGRLNQE